MNNKPVAWMSPDGKVSDTEGKLFYIPLYTHPAKELKNIVVASATCSCGKVMEVTNLQPVKELTDEEIEEVIRKHWNKQYGNRNMLTLCKAVLKEANK